MEVETDVFFRFVMYIPTDYRKKKIVMQGRGHKSVIDWMEGRDLSGRNDWTSLAYVNREKSVISMEN